MTAKAIEAALKEWSKPNDKREPIEIMRAAIAAYEAALWQPIETAPIDGTEVIITDICGVAVAAFDGVEPLEEFLQFCDEGETADDYPAFAEEREQEAQGWMRRGAISGYIEFIASPTHWRPLPHPPQEAGQ